MVVASSILVHSVLVVFFFNDTATTEIYTLSLHDALPILLAALNFRAARRWRRGGSAAPVADRKSTRLNSSHLGISYAVFCLKKQKLVWYLYLLTYCNVPLFILLSGP